MANQKEFLQILADFRSKVVEHYKDREKPCPDNYCPCVLCRLTATIDAAKEQLAIKDPLITVCAACNRACCWHGEFMCEDAVGADTKRVKESELIKLRLEHPDYWKLDPEYGEN